MSSAVIARNTTYLTSALIVQKVLSFFLFLFIARTLGSERTGEYVAAFSFTSIFGVFADLGLAPVLIREIARKREKSYFYLGNVIAVKLGLSIIVYLALLASVYALFFWGQGHPPIILIVIAGGVMVIDSFSLTASSVLRGWQNLWYESMAVIINKVIILILGVLALWLWPSPITIALIILLGSVVSLIILFQAIKKSLGEWPPWGWDRHVQSELWSLAKPFALANIFAAVYSYSDSVLLSIMQNNTAVGLYSLASKTMNAFQFIPMAFMAAVYPAMSAWHREFPDKLRQLLEQSLRYLLIISVPLSVGLYILADKFVGGLGNEFMSSAAAVRILVPSLVFVFLSFPMGSLLNAANRQNWQTSIIITTTVINVGLNLWLIPRYSFIGASWSWFIANFLALIAGFYLSRLVIKYSFTNILKSLIRVAMATLIMGLMVLLLLTKTSVILTIVVAGIVYLALLLILGEITASDFYYLLSLYKKSFGRDKTLWPEEN